MKLSRPGDAVAEVREASDLLRFYAVKTEFSMEAVSLSGLTEETDDHHLRPHSVLLGISS